MLLSLLALSANVASAGDYAVPSAFPTVQAAVTASLADPSAVVLVDPAYNAVAEAVVSLAGWSGAIRSSTPGVLAPSPALHDVDGAVTVADLRIGLAPGLYATSYGVVVTGSFTADHIAIPGLLVPGASVGVASSGTATLELTRAEVYGQTGGAVVADGGAVTLADSDLHDNNLSMVLLPVWYPSAGLYVGANTVATVTGTRFRANAGAGFDQAAGVLAVGEASLTVRGGVFEGLVGNPVVGMGASDVVVETSRFDGTTMAAAGAVVTYSVATVGVSGVDVLNCDGGEAGALLINGVPMEQFFQVQTTLTASHLTVTDTTGSTAGVAYVLGDVVSHFSDVTALRTVSPAGSAGLTLHEGVHDVQVLTVTDAEALNGGAIWVPPGPFAPVPTCLSWDLTANDVSVIGTWVAGDGGAVDIQASVCARFDALNAQRVSTDLDGGLVSVRNGALVNVTNATGDHIDALGDGALFFVDGGGVLDANVGAFNVLAAWYGGVASNRDGDVHIASYDVQDVVADQGGLAYAGAGFVTMDCVNACGISANKGIISYNGYSADATLTGSTVSDVVGTGFEPTLFEAAVESSLKLWVDGNSIVGIPNGVAIMDDTGWGYWPDFLNSAFDADSDGVTTFGTTSHGWSPLPGSMLYCSFVGYDPAEFGPGGQFEWSVLNDGLITPATSGFVNRQPGVCDPVGLVLTDLSDLVDMGDPLDLDIDGSPRDIGAFGGPDACLLVIDADGDGSPSDADCNDNDATIYPGATELPYDGIDQDCNGADLCDVDGDTYLAAAGSCGGDDCNDDDATVHPGATELPYDGIDQDCVAGDLCDVDADGYDAMVGSCGGDDCNDDDASIHPNATELPYDGVDQDCVAGDLCDVDADGYDAMVGSCGGDDCDDDDASIHPNATELPYDGIDQDCVAGDLCDVDGDTYLSAEGSCGGDDCNDDDASIHPNATELPYDGIDQDCVAGDLCDVDGDTYLSPEGACGGDDCNDDDASIHPNATELPYDGVDQDCVAGDLCDVDGDTYLSPDGACGGDDCNDTDAGVNPLATEIWYDGTDQNCDGNDDDQDVDGYPVDSDCVDTDVTVHPDAEDVPDDGVDQNCNGQDAKRWLQGGCSSTGGSAPGLLGLLLSLMAARRREVRS